MYPFFKPADGIRLASVSPLRYCRCALPSGAVRNRTRMKQAASLTATEIWSPSLRITTFSPSPNPASCTRTLLGLDTTMCRAQSGRGCTPPSSHSPDGNTSSRHPALSPAGGLRLSSLTRKEELERGARDDRRSLSAAGQFSLRGRVLRTDSSHLGNERLTYLRARGRRETGERCLRSYIRSQSPLDADDYNRPGKRIGEAGGSVSSSLGRQVREHLNQPFTPVSRRSGRSLRNASMRGPRRSMPRAGDRYVADSVALCLIPSPRPAMRNGPTTPCLLMSISCPRLRRRWWGESTLPMCSTTAMYIG